MTIAALISAGGVLLSVGLSVLITVFVIGTKWGNVETKVNVMSDRLAKIEGMFTLTLRGGGESTNDRSV